MTPARRYLPALATLLLAFLVLSFLPPVAQATCAAPKNGIEAENWIISVLFATQSTISTTSTITSPML